MAQSVDPNRVIEKLTKRLSTEILNSVINEVALEDSNAALTQGEQPGIPNGS